MISGGDVKISSLSTWQGSSNLEGGKFEKERMGTTSKVELIGTPLDVGQMDGRNGYAWS